MARLGVAARKGTLTPTLSQRERDREESPLPRFGGEGQGEGVCHDYHGLQAFETVSDARPTKGTRLQPQRIRCNQYSLQLFSGKGLFQKLSQDPGSSRKSGTVREDTAHGALTPICVTFVFAVMWSVS